MDTRGSGIPDDRRSRARVPERNAACRRRRQRRWRRTGTDAAFSSADSYSGAPSSSSTTMSSGARPLSVTATSSRRRLPELQARLRHVDAAQGDARPRRANARLPCRDGLGGGEGRVAVSAAVIARRRHRTWTRTRRPCASRCSAAGARDRALGKRDPARRVAGRAALVVQRNHLVLQDLVERARFLAIAALADRACRRGLDRPAVVAVVAFGPPAVEHREVDHAVDARLHSRGARRLQRVDRVVEPHVDAGDEPAREPQVVALEEAARCPRTPACARIARSCGSCPGPARRPGAPCRRTRRAPAARGRSRAAPASRGSRTTALRACRSRSGAEADGQHVGVAGSASAAADRGATRCPGCGNAGRVRARNVCSIRDLRN